MDEKNLLSSVAEKTDEHEYFSSFPEGYEIGKTKYVFVLGTVISGLGKGIFSSSLAMLLKSRGIKVEPIKLEGYLNLDSGTLNPYRHGEVFVLNDGTEADMDLGTYERYLDMDLDKDNFSTNGQLFKKILEREREGRYLGRDVQFIPHVTAQVRQSLRELAMKNSSDVVFVEIGGTVGDIENAHYIESIREMIYEEGKENTAVVALTYILKPTALGEQKSKAAQLGLRSLMGMGLVPDIIACRCAYPVDLKVREKISITSNVPVENVISLHNTKSIYNVPFMLKDSRVDEMIGRKLNLRLKEKADLEGWKKYNDTITSVREKIVVGITGKYTGLRDSYASIIMALEHSGVFFGYDVCIKWIETTSFEDGSKNIEEELLGLSGIIVPGGFGKRGTEGKISCVNYARKNNMPFLGLCLGFQMAVIDYARDVCGMRDANTTEVKQDTRYPVIDILPEQEGITSLGGNMRLGIRDVELKPGTFAYELYGKNKLIRERFRHRYEVQPSMIAELESKGLVFSGKAPDEMIMQILELPGHPFFVASQFHPEFTSRPLRPNPLFKGFVDACIKCKK